MKDSYNYSGLAKGMVISNKARKSNRKRGLIIGENLDDASENNLVKHYPPYLLEESAVKPLGKK